MDEDSRRRSVEQRRQTLIEKYGSEEAYIARTKAWAAKGGSRQVAKGFASDVVGKDGLTGRQRNKLKQWGKNKRSIKPEGF